jgi:4a-hydroxytetrahydrobiopterin dehydratase
MARLPDEERLLPRHFHRSEGVEEWRVLAEGACSFFRTDSFATSVRLVEAMGTLPALAHNPPDLDVRADGVTVRLITIADNWFGLSTRDVERARQISKVARDLGLSGDPSSVQSVLIIPGASSVPQVMPFWRAVMGYEPRPDSPDEDLVDPRGRGPAFWFEKMLEPRSHGGGGAIHIVVWVPPEQAEARIAAAIAAGGRMVRDQHAPAWWTLADPAGNEVDVATTATRD